MPPNKPWDPRAGVRPGDSGPGTPGRGAERGEARADEAPPGPRQDDPIAGRGARPEREPGRDALTRPPGAHPVGIGAGAAAGGAAGALLGAAAGPVGAVVGGALGAVAGGYIGRETAEAINPTAEDRYWAEAYSRRPYISAGETYEYYRPAYHFGWECYRRHAGVDGVRVGEVPSFDELEPVLGAEWAHTNASATLPWERARPAARDAWNRVAMAGHEGAVDALERLYDTCLESSHSFRIAADGLSDPAYVDLVESWAMQREALADELAMVLARLGAEPAPESVADPAGPRIWMRVRDALPRGPRAVLTECERSEDYVEREYESALARTLPLAVSAVLERHHAVVSVTHDQVRSLRDAAPE